MAQFGFFFLPLTSQSIATDVLWCRQLDRFWFVEFTAERRNKIFSIDTNSRQQKSLINGTWSIRRVQSSPNKQDNETSNKRKFAKWQFNWSPTRTIASTSAHTHWRALNPIGTMACLYYFDHKSYMFVIIARISLFSFVVVVVCKKIFVVFAVYSVCFRNSVHPGTNDWAVLACETFECVLAYARIKNCLVVY